MCRSCIIRENQKTIWNCFPIRSRVVDMVVKVIIHITKAYTYVFYACFFLEKIKWFNNCSFSLNLGTVCWQMFGPKRCSPCSKHLGGPFCLTHLRVAVKCSPTWAKVKVSRAVWNVEAQSWLRKPLKQLSREGEKENQLAPPPKVLRNQELRRRSEPPRRKRRKVWKSMTISHFLIDCRGNHFVAYSFIVWFCFAVSQC